MKNLTNTFRLLEITRFQPQYGYALAGISKSEQSDLAQHHYLVTIFAWILTLEINARGGNLNVLRTVEICLTHDLGELFGGDIGMPYVRANPTAKLKDSRI
jgi:Predicted hydrolases of HD superfamily